MVSHSEMKRPAKVRIEAPPVVRHFIGTRSLESGVGGTQMAPLQHPLPRSRQRGVEETRGLVWARRLSWGPVTLPLVSLRKVVRSSCCDSGSRDGPVLAGTRPVDVWSWQCLGREAPAGRERAPGPPADLLPGMATCPRACRGPGVSQALDGPEVGSATAGGRPDWGAVRPPSRVTLAGRWALGSASGR